MYTVLYSSHTEVEYSVPYLQYTPVKETQMRRKTVRSSLNKNIQGSARKLGSGEGGKALLRPPPPPSRQIFEDDVNGFFLHLGYLFHAVHIVYIVYRWTACLGGWTQDNGVTLFLKLLTENL